ncbi:1-phosphatidylinositol 45-bisphosphate phosphodiesterase beta-4 [Taenia crassiceps]|uniref:1-phosphatidylinositol 4,5-bisphosphate phosphodiesterase n=1 Tax=Taenia crassiceps TaxID=6207 RepID=A0ABR4QQ22_9CEST
MSSDIAKRQRTVPSTKAYDFVWRRPVPVELREGSYFDRYEEETGTLELGCFLRVDEDGFFLFWKSEANEGQVLELSQVSDVRQGTKPKDEKLLGALMERMPSGGKNLDERIVTVCSGLDLVNISYTNFVAASSEVASLWIQSVRGLTHNTKAQNVCPMTQLRKHWLRITLTVNPRGKIPVRVVTKTFASGRNERIIFQSLKDLGLPSGKNDEVEPSDFTFERFYELYHKICPRTDIEELFKSLSHGRDTITADKMIGFLNEVQRDPRLNEILYPYANRQTIRYIQETYDSRDKNISSDTVSLKGFYRYLMSDDNAPVFLDRLDIYQDMDQPLCHYYINSSHNTYLIGRQFGGKSSVEIYRQVLLAGCRCIELDCWDGKGEDQEPIITHGKAMCSDILFKDVIYAVRDTAFVTSEYPLIMSFENHCSKHQQYKLAKYCEDILGDMLLTKPLDKYPLEPGVPLPSPEKLKRKILIKNKRLDPDVEKHQLELFMKGQADPVQEEDDVAEDPDPLGSTDCDVSPINGDIDPHPEAKLRPGSGQINALSTSGVFSSSLLGKLSETEMKRLVTKKGSLTAEEEQAMLAQYHYTGATKTIHPLLSSMVNYAQPVKFQGFDVAEDENIHYHMSSFSETVALGLMKNEAIEFVNYNKRQMSRIYPRGNRVESSNYMPQIFWNAGCQMVALNFQTPDLAMQLNQGKFEYNGNCGYLLKPEFMRRPERQFDPFSESPMDGVIAATCEVRIISGQFLSDRKVGTYVEVDMYGLPTDTIRKEFRTRVVPNNGLNPVYGEDAVFVFRKVVLPDLAVLRFAVYEDTGKLIGQRVLPLDGLQSGYRHISLRTEGNFPLSLPTLFCRVSLTTYVPEGLNDLVDALSDPRAFLSKEEQRMKQLASMGIDSSEIDEVPTSSTKLTSMLKQRPMGSGITLSSMTSGVPMGGASCTGTGGGGGGSGGSGASAGPASALGLPSLCPSNDPHRLATASSTGVSASTVHGSGASCAAVPAPGSSGNSAKKEEKKEDPKFPPISLAMLRSDKNYRKLVKKQAKELESLQRRHEKEAATMLRTHSLLTDKLNASHAKAIASSTSSLRGTPQNHLLRGLNRSRLASLPTKLVNGVGTPLKEAHIAQMNSLVRQQTDEWSKLKCAQMSEIHTLILTFIDSRKDLLLKILRDAHEEQRRLLKQIQERENKDMKAQQIKISLDSNRNVMNDPKLKNKAERDRRIRELKDYNTKRFIDQRKAQAQRNDRQAQDLLRRHEEEEQGVIAGVNRERDELIPYYNDLNASQGYCL